jgi:phosphoglycerol transferase MdoB-like AlkP superfamily enzyme
VAVACYFLLSIARWRCNKDSFMPLNMLQKKMSGSFYLLLIGGIIFLAIRGGVGRSTANVGMVYYSNNQYLNHTAVNPVFSIFYSLKKTANYAEQYDFFEEEKRSRLFEDLCYNTESLLADTLLSVQRPNILIIIMEGCGAPFVESLGGASGVTPCLKRLASEGILFSRCYANSFRTDRGTVSALSGGILIYSIRTHVSSRLPFLMTDTSANPSLR